MHRERVSTNYNVVTDSLAKQVESIWKTFSPDASLLPVIGLPSNANGVATLTHGMSGMPPMKINGLVSRSPLANNALYSFESVDGYYLNLYEIMIPDIPGGPGEISTAQIYIDAQV